MLNRQASSIYDTVSVFMCVVMCVTTQTHTYTPAFAVFAGEGWGRRGGAHTILRGAHAGHDGML